MIKDNEQQARLISQCKNFRLRHEREKLPGGGEEPITSFRHSGDGGNSEYFSNDYVYERDE